MKTHLRATIISSVIFSLLAAPLAYAEISGSSTTATSTKPATSYNISCVQNAVDKRETSLISAVDTFTASIKTALTTRKDALKSAWAITAAKERRTARNNAWTAYRTSAKSAHTALKTARKSAYDTFETDMKACKVTGYSERENLSVETVTSL